MWIRLFSLLLIADQCFGQWIIDIYYTFSTDTSLKASISTSVTQNFPYQVELNEVWVNSSSILQLQNEKINAVIDLTCSISISQALKELANQYHFILISSENFSNSYNGWQFFTHNSNEDQEKALLAVIHLLNWEKFITIFDEDSVNIYRYLQENFSIIESNSYFFSNSENQTLANNFVGKEIKPRGIRNIVILNQGESSGWLLKSLNQMNMMINGTGIILGSKSWWGVSGDGFLGYTESELENANDIYSYESLAIVKLLKLILEFPNCSNGLMLRQYLEKNTINHRPLPKFMLVNTNNDYKNIVGVIEKGFLTLNDSLLFPGNSLSIPNSPTTQISIWMADGVTNPGFANSPLTGFLKYGAHYALYHSSQNRFLEGFEILITHTDCGAEVFIPEYALECFSKLKNNPGVAYLTVPFPVPLFGYLSILKSLNISMPIISEYSTPGALGNKTDYPLFMRVAGYDLYHTSVLTNLINIFEWKNIILICENSEDNNKVHDYIVKWAESYKISIVNAPEDRWVMQNYNASCYNETKDWMMRIIDLKVRPILFFVTPPAEYEMIIDFYKAGLRPENCVFLIPNRIGYAQILVTDPARKQILIELLYGSIILNEAEWLGDYGQEILQGFLKYYYPFSSNDFKCLSFDGAMLLLHGIKYTLNKGENVENATALNFYLRQQKFLGCSGSVSIESWSNNRNSAILGIYNMRWNASINKIYESLCGIYDLGSEQLFTFTENLVWYNNDTKIPKDTIENSECPFNKNLVRYSRKGAAFFYALCLFIDVITVIMVFYIWSKWCNTEIPKLIKVSKINFEDYIEMVIIFIDFLQILSMGPDMSGYDEFAYYFSNMITINMDWFTKGKNLWFYVFSSVIIVTLWIFFNIENTFKCSGNLGRVVCEFIRPVSKLVMPLIGNICFLPIISVLLSSWACYESIGPMVTQTFVHQDCSTFCWENFHIFWGSLSIVSLIVYLPSAIYFRPLLDNSIKKNIKSRPIFWMVKSIFQLNVVILNKVIKAYYEWLFGLLYIAMILALIYFCFKHKPYNYERMNLWLIILYFSDIWSILLSSIYSLSNYHSKYLWMSLQYTGWAILIIVGVLIQAICYPSLQVTEIPVDIGILFRFELGKSIKADEINKKNAEKLSNKCSPESVDDEKSNLQEVSK